MLCGFDIGGTKVLGVAVDPADPVRPVAVQRNITLEDSDALVETIEKTVAALEADCGAPMQAVGVGIAGIVTRDGVLRYSPNIAGVLDLELRTRLRDGLQRPVTVENDASAAAFAEYSHGAGQGSRDVILVALGTGIGTGLVLDGNLYRGWQGFAGEAGHMIVEQTGPRHITGARGPWEYYASGTGLSRMAATAAAAGRFAGVIDEAGSIEAIRGEHVHSRIAAGDPDALAVLDEFCDHVAVGLSGLIHVLDPEVVVIAGGLVDIGDPLVSGISKHTARHVLGGEHRPPVRVVAAQLGSAAGAIGAALLAAATHN